MGATPERAKGCLPCNPSLHQDCTQAQVYTLFSPCFFVFRDIRLDDLTNSKQLAVPSSAHHILYTYHLYQIYAVHTTDCHYPSPPRHKNPTVSIHSPKTHYLSVTTRLLC